jgi:membrane associated rhomboid family serine protease
VAYQQQAIEIVKDIFSSITNVPMVGASGAVFGILMAFGMLFPNTQLFLLFPPIPIKAKYLVLFYGLYELYSEFSRTSGDNVAHLAHLGGMLIAYILLKIWQKDNGRFY